MMTSPTAPAFQPKSGMRFVTLLTLVTLAHALVIVLMLAHFGWLSGVGVETDENAGQSGIVIPVTLETAGDEEKQSEEKVESAAEAKEESTPTPTPTPIAEPSQTQEDTQEAVPTSPEVSPSPDSAADIPTQSDTASPTAPIAAPPEAPPPMSPSTPAPAAAPVVPTSATSDASSNKPSNSASKGTSSEAVQANIASDSLPTIPAQVDPNYLHRPDPVYPALSKRFRETGTVLLRVSLDASGAVRDVAVQTSSEYQRLDQAAQEAVRQWRFIPASRGQQAISSTVLVPIEFKHQ